MGRTQDEVGVRAPQVYAYAVMHVKPEPSRSRVVELELELYWLAGLLEGEGSFLAGPPSNPRCPLVRLPMTDEDVVGHAARLLCRAVTPWDRKSVEQRKRVFITTIQGAAAVGLMRSLDPVMGTRRRGQIARALAAPHVDRVRAVIRDAVCAVAGCDRRVRSRGLCLEHYRSWWKAVRNGRTPKFEARDVLPPALESGPLAVMPVDDARSIAWVAGLLEGEGTFANIGGYPTISASLCDRDVLERAAAIIGITTVSPKSVTRNADHGWTPAFQISLTGARAADWMRTLRSSMGARRSHEIDIALEAYHPIRLTKAPDHCVVLDCGEPHRGRGLCHKHYMQWDRDRKAGKIPRVAPLR